VSNIVSFGAKLPTTYVAPTAEEFLARAYPPKEPLIEGLLHRRDLVAFGAKRRNGKTSLLTNMAVALAVGVPEFLGYAIPAARRSLLFMLEDDPGEYQNFLKEFIADRATGGRIRVITRDDIMDQQIPIDVEEERFRTLVENVAVAQRPDVIFIDNLAQVINAEYNDPKRVHRYIQFIYSLSKKFNAAVVTAIHPKKDDLALGQIDLAERPNDFFETFMGSSHFINSTGSLWGLQRKDDFAVFVGGRQRSEGSFATSYIWRPRRPGWFELVPDLSQKLQVVTKTPKRKRAWELLPEAPQTFSYSEGEALVRPALSSRDSYHAWISEMKRLKVIVETEEEGRYVKAMPGVVRSE